MRLLKIAYEDIFDSNSISSGVSNNFKNHVFVRSVNLSWAPMLLFQDKLGDSVTRTCISSSPEGNFEKRLGFLFLTSPGFYGDSAQYSFDFGFVFDFNALVEYFDFYYIFSEDSGKYPYVTNELGLGEVEHFRMFLAFKEDFTPSLKKCVKYAIFKRGLLRNLTKDPKNSEENSSIEYKKQEIRNAITGLKFAGILYQEY